MIESSMASVKLAMMGLVALSALDAAKGEVETAIDEITGGRMSTTKVLTCGLKEESLRGYVAGIMSAIKVIEGADPFDEFHAYERLIDGAANDALEHAFACEVEHYSESGEG